MRTELETRLPCPVCLGTRMEKVHVADEFIALDCCRRCGGVWFEQGEAQQVRRLSPATVMGGLGASLDVSRAPCHACRAPVARDALSCPACGHHLRLACPACQQEMAAATLDELRLDVCRGCHGVWFDRHELAALWSEQLEVALRRRRRGGAGDLGLLEAFAYSPDLAFYGAYAAGDMVVNAGTGLGEAVGSAGGVAEAVGEAAASVFETIAGIIAGIFS